MEKEPCGLQRPRRSPSSGRNTSGRTTSRTRSAYRSGRSPTRTLLGPQQQPTIQRTSVLHPKLPEHWKKDHESNRRTQIPEKRSYIPILPARHLNIIIITSFIAILVMSTPVQGAPLPKTSSAHLDPTWWTALPGFDAISSLLDFIQAQLEAIEHVARIAEDHLAFNYSEPTMEPLRKKRSSSLLSNLTRPRRALVNNDTLQLVERTIPIIQDLLSPPILRDLITKSNATVATLNQTLTTSDSKKEDLSGFALGSFLAAICFGTALIVGIALRCFDEVLHSDEDSPAPDASSLSHSYISILPWGLNLPTPALSEEEHIYEVMA